MKLIDKIDKNKMMRLLLLKKKTPIRLHDRVLIEHNPEGSADAIVKYLIPLR